MKKVLLVAYHFPPMGTGGVGRALGWVRHLPACGWQTSVLAAPPPPGWPLDSSLESQIPEGTTIRRVAAFDPRPSRLRGLAHRELSFLWRRAAVREGARMLARERFDIVLATAPPPAAHAVASQLSRRFGIPWVADFRDPWGVRAPAFWRRWRRQVYLKNAAAIVAVNDTLSAHLQDACGRDVVTIFNGFDPDDMPEQADRHARRVVFLGTLSAFNTLDALFSALARLHGEFVHIGAERAYDLRERARQNGLTRVISAGYLPRARALELAATASVFALSLKPDLELAVSAKTFDYIGLGGPVLCLGEHGALADFVRSRPALGKVVDADSGAAVESALAELFAAAPSYPPEERARFERPRLAAELARVLDSVAAGV